MVLENPTEEVIIHCPCCGAHESMFKATVWLNENPMHFSHGFHCCSCNFYMEVLGCLKIAKDEIFERNQWLS